MQDEHGSVFRELVSHRCVPQVNTRGEIQVVTSVAIVERAGIGPPLPSRNCCIVVGAGARGSNGLLEFTALQLITFFLNYAVANPLQKMGKAGNKNARLRDFILLPVFNDNPE
jgi:hypothetical protein